VVARSRPQSRSAAARWRREARKIDGYSRSLYASPRTALAETGGPSRGAETPCGIAIAIAAGSVTGAGMTIPWR
jgi:hypothetical protein